MNEWLVAAIALLALLGPCLLVCALANPASGLIAMELAGTIVTSILLVLAAGVHRQSFVDLALVFAALSFTGALAFARLLERRL
jgi:multisubunit Na+/H+ antiporter MnhF subunit